MNAQEEYFRAIFADFEEKIETIARLIKQHPGEAGRFVEGVITNLLKSFLPTRYSIGSGFVIDSEGKQSRQCDIVIFDETFNNRLFSHGGQVLFPVESVYAVCEIKTTFTSKEVSDAFDHIRSVKSLVNKAAPVFEWALTEIGVPEYRCYPPTPPIGIVIGYQCRGKNMSTIKGWFEGELSNIPVIDLQPDICVSVIEGLKVRAGNYTTPSPEFKYYPIFRRDENGDVILDEMGVPTGIRPNWKAAPGEKRIQLGSPEGYDYALRPKRCNDPNKSEYLADARRTLLTTLQTIERLLRIKRLTPLDSRTYLPPYYSWAIRL